MRYVKRWAMIAIVTMIFYLTMPIFAVLFLSGEFDSEINDWLFSGDLMKMKIVYCAMLILAAALPVITILS